MPQALGAVPRDELDDGGKNAHTVALGSSAARMAAGTDGGEAVGDREEGGACPLVS